MQPAGVQFHVDVQAALNSAWATIPVGHKGRSAKKPGMLRLVLVPERLHKNVVFAALSRENQLKFISAALSDLPLDGFEALAEIDSGRSESPAGFWRVIVPDGSHCALVRVHSCLQVLLQFNIRRM